MIEHQNKNCNQMLLWQYPSSRYQNYIKTETKTNFHSSSLQEANKNMIKLHTYMTTFATAKVPCKMRWARPIE